MKWAGWLFLLAAPICHATPETRGINLFWDDCGAFGTMNKTFACDSNTGVNVLVGSFVAGDYLVSVNGMTASVGLQSACSAFPDWWSMRAGYCRSTSLIGNFDFTTGPANCFDYWQGQAIGTASMDDPVGRNALVTLQCALPVIGSNPGPIEKGTHVYALKMIINNAKTVGPGACAGCQDDMCIVLNYILVRQTPGNSNYVYPNSDLSQVVAWHGGQWNWYHLEPGGNCVGDCPTPTRARTWGQVKGLYR